MTAPNLTPHGLPNLATGVFDGAHIQWAAQDSSGRERNYQREQVRLHEMGAVNVAWVDGTPEYRAAVTADLRRRDVERLTRELANPRNEDHRDYSRAVLADVVKELAQAEAVLRNAAEIAASERKETA